MIHATQATCYDLAGKAADGHYVDRRTAASNFLLPGTRIRLVGKHSGPGGIRKYVVHDTGPALSDGHIDLHAWGGCATYGRRAIAFVLGWRRPTRRERRIAIAAGA